MKPLVIEQTPSTLGLDFDPAKGLLAMRGESYPEDVLKFFNPVLEWLNDYFADLGPGAGVEVDMDIMFFNSSSSKALMIIFDTLEKAAEQGVRVSIVWRYHQENEVARECGEEFGEDLDKAEFVMAPYGDC